MTLADYGAGVLDLAMRGLEAKRWTPTWPDGACV
jgi:hypothetical protein